MVSKSCSFLFPILEIDYQEAKRCGLIDVYSNASFLPEAEWGKYIVLPFDQDTINLGGSRAWDLIRKMKVNKRFDRQISHDKMLIFVFKLTEEEYYGIGLPFTKGQYSKIDRGYVNKYFSEYTPTGVSTNWQILNKDKALWEYWSETIYGESGRTLDEDAEVWSAPLFSEETLQITMDEMVSRDCQIPDFRY